MITEDVRIVTESLRIVADNFSDDFWDLRSNEDSLFPMSPQRRPRALQNLRNEIYQTRPHKRKKLLPKDARRLFSTFVEFGITHAKTLGLSLGRYLQNHDEPQSSAEY
jgi:hypothetical protein